MSEFKIVKGIPIPPHGRGRSPKGPSPTRKYPFLSMVPGDSVFVPGKRPASITGPISYAEVALAARFTCLTVNGGVRVWRVS